MKFSGKKCTLIMLKVIRKVGLYLLCREYNFEKTTRGQNDSLLTASLFRFKR